MKITDVEVIILEGPELYHAPEGGAVKFTASSAGIVVYHNTFIAPVHPMLLAAWKMALGDESAAVFDRDPPVT